MFSDHGNWRILKSLWLAKWLAEKMEHPADQIKTKSSFMKSNNKSRKAANTAVQQFHNKNIEFFQQARTQKQLRFAKAFVTYVVRAWDAEILRSIHKHLFTLMLLGINIASAKTHIISEFTDSYTVEVYISSYKGILILAYLPSSTPT